MEKQKTQTATHVGYFLKKSLPLFEQKLQVRILDMTFKELEELLGMLYTLRHNVYLEYVRKMPEEVKHKKHE